MIIRKLSIITLFFTISCFSNSPVSTVNTNDKNKDISDINKPINNEDKKEPEITPTPTFTPTNQETDGVTKRFYATLPGSTPIPEKSPEIPNITTSSKPIISFEHDSPETKIEVVNSPINIQQTPIPVKKFSRGEKVIYISNESGISNIYISNRDGTESSLIYSNSKNQSYPVFSKNAEYIYFINTLIDGANDIYKIFQDGTNLERVTNIAKSISSFNVSDSGNIVFIENNQLFLQEGEKLFQLSKGSENISNPIWSNDNEISFLNEKGDIYSISKDGEKLIEVLKNEFINSFDIKFSKIAFSNSEGIWIKELNNNKNKILSDSKIKELRFSPDGNYVIFTSTKSGKRQIYSIGVGGENLIQITKNDFENFNPFW